MSDRNRPRSGRRDVELRRQRAERRRQEARKQQIQDEEYEYEQQDDYSRKRRNVDGFRSVLKDLSKGQVRTQRRRVRYVKKEHVRVRRFAHVNRVKMLVVFGLVVSLLCALILRLGYINATKGDAYAKQVLSQMNYDSRDIPFRRGDIVDRNGTVLATSEKVYNLVVDAYVMINSKVKETGDCMQPTLDIIDQFFKDSGVDVKAVRDYIDDNPESRYYVVAKQIPYEKVDAYNNYFETDEKGKYVNQDAGYIKGVWFEEEYIRKYPYSSLEADVIGFTYSGNVGAYGLEAYYNDQLNGTNGREYGYLDEDGLLERSIVAPTNGNTVVTTLDINVMQIVRKHLAEFNEAFGSMNSAVIVQKVDTGEILAMDSYPFFDCNNPYDVEKYWEKSVWDAKTDEEKMLARQAIWRNFCITDTYEPGSTVKTFTVASALDEGIIKQTNNYYCGGGLTFPDGTSEVHVSCINTSGHGTLTLSQALQYSCNAALMQIGLSMGKSQMVKMWNNFGLGMKTNIDLPGEASGIIRDTSMSNIDLAICSFGQSYNVTMAQVASGFSSIVNGGNYYRPRVCSRIESEDGSVLATYDKELVRTTVSKETSEWMLEALERTVDVDDASGHYAYLEGYRLGGKTGTAEKLPRNQGHYLVSFISAAPIDDPEIVVYVVVDEASATTGAYSMFASIMAKKIYQDLLPYMQIFPSNTSEEVEQEEEETYAGYYTIVDENGDTYYIDDYGNVLETDDEGNPILNNNNSYDEQESESSSSGDADEETEETLLSPDEVNMLREEYTSEGGANFYQHIDYDRK